MTPRLALSVWRGVRQASCWKSHKRGIGTARLVAWPLSVGQAINRRNRTRPSNAAKRQIKHFSSIRLPSVACGKASAAISVAGGTASGGHQA